MEWLSGLLEEASGERAAGWWGRKSKRDHLCRSGLRPRLGLSCHRREVPLQAVNEYACSLFLRAELVTLCHQLLCCCADSTPSAEPSPPALPRAGVQLLSARRLHAGDFFRQSFRAT